VRRVAGVLAGCLAFLALTLALLEGALRAFPAALIPRKTLARFEPGLRGEIARRLGLNEASEVWFLERDDGGPLLWLPKPFSAIHFDDGVHESVFRMDAQGFCNAARDTYERERIDLVAVGDSFTACLVDEPESTWPSRLGELGGLPVYNVSRGGIGPYEYVQLLRRFGLPKRPRVVVVNVYEGNDLRDAVRYHEHASGSPHAGAPDAERAAPLAAGPACGSYALALATAAAAGVADDLRQTAGRLARPGDPEHARIDFRYALRLPEGTVPFNGQNTDQSEVRLARLLEAGRVSLDAFDGALEALAALSRAHGFAAIVSYAPSAHTAYAPFVDFEDDSLASLLPRVSAAQRRHLRERAEALGLAFVDLTPALQEAARRSGGRELLYDATNLHWTPAGHRVVAEALARALAAPAQGSSLPR
jgi:hypothetical protein